MMHPLPITRPSPTLSMPPQFPASPFVEECLKALEEDIHKFRERITTTRVLRHRLNVPKTPQIHLLMAWCDGDIDQFRCKVHVDPPTFDGILEKIHNHHCKDSACAGLAQRPLTPLDLARPRPTPQARGDRFVLAHSGVLRLHSSSLALVVARSLGLDKE